MTLLASLKSRTNSVWNMRLNSVEVSVRSNGADLFLTAGVTKFGETSATADVDLCAEDEQLSGIITGQGDRETNFDKDSDDTFADNTILLMGMPVVGAEIYLTAKVATAVTHGKIVQCDGGFFENTDFAAAQTSANVPYAASMLLQALETLTGVSGITKIFLAKRV